MHCGVELSIHQTDRLESILPINQAGRHKQQMRVVEKNRSTKAE
jgi:hypothetical protein